MQRLIFTALACLFSVSVYGQTVYTKDQITFNDDSNLVLNKSDNTPISGVVEIYSGGQLAKIEKYKNGKKEGPWKFYNDWNGELYQEVNYKNGKQEGRWIRYNEGGPYSEEYNGQLSEEYNYKNGKKEGLNKTYRSNGQLSKIENYKNGELEGLASHYYSNNGQLEKEINYKNGKKEGLFIEYYRNGNIKAEINFTNDKREGLGKEYDYVIKGQLKREVLFTKNKIVLDKYYHENGQVGCQIDYKDGMELSSKCWDESGNDISCEDLQMEGR